MVVVTEIKLTAGRQVIQRLCCSKYHLFNPSVLFSAPAAMQHEAVPAHVLPPKEPHGSPSQNVE